MRIKAERTLWVLVLTVLMSVTSCSLMKGKEIGERGVAQFHQQFNAEKYHEIYSQADEGFRKTITEPDCVALFEAVHKKLGVVKTANQLGVRANATPNGTIVVMDYDVEFTEGKAVENFTFKVQGEKAVLLGWNINSNLLITK